MAVIRTDIERALDELASQEEGMRFQGLAVVLGKKRWPELIARQRKKDFGLDAYASSSLSLDGIGKGLAASITPTLRKISCDVKTAKENFPDLKMLLFVTSAKIGNADRKLWEQVTQKDHDVELHILEREEIITLLMMPENASLSASFLHINVHAAPEFAELVARTRRAADAVTRAWSGRTKGYPLIELAAVRIDPSGAESADVLSLEQIEQALLRSGRIVLEGPAGRGKTTMLIQFAQRAHTACIPFIIEVPAWTSSRRGILEYITGMPAFQVEGLTSADLARVQQKEPFLLLLNGWNEVAESNSAQANDALRELERDFPSAGIVVATRTHHVTPPLPGALRLRLLRLRRAQRAAYLEARLGAKSAELGARIDADTSLDELTRTPFILSEVASLFEAGAEIPSTKVGVLAQVLRLQEQRDEHRNALETGPIFGRQTDYLKALANKMTGRGTVMLPEVDARAVTAAVARELADSGQIDLVGAPAVLAALTAHHVLERVDYPEKVFQFEHQQLQEFYAAHDVRARLFDLREDDCEAIVRFTADYVNDSAWAEPLRMIAETFAEKASNGRAVMQSTRVGGKLVEMALAVDLVFAGELAKLCGPAVWNQVRDAVGERFRAVHATRDDNYQRYAVAAMLATGAEDFSDIVLPLLSGPDQQTRLRTYRLWPDLQCSSLGSNWREEVRGWSDEARVDFVSELLHHRSNEDIAAFAAVDNSIEVKMAAASGLMWTRSDDMLILVLESMDAQTFEDIARRYPDLIPGALKPKTVAAMRNFVMSTTDHLACLQTTLALIEMGETGLDDIVKDAMAALAADRKRNLNSHFVQPPLEYLSKIDPAWTSEWVAIQIAEGILYEDEYWLQFATAIPDGIVQKYLHRLETEDLKNASFGGMIAVIAVCADAKLAACVFEKLRELQRKVDSEPGLRHEFEWQVTRQLEAVFRRLPDDIAVAGILSSITGGNTLDMKVAVNLLSRVARSDVEPLHIADGDLKARLCAYLKDSVSLVLREDDYNGEEKANLASSIAQVGKPADMTDLVTLIRADIERMRRGQAARAAGDRGPLGNGGHMSYAGWHTAAVIYLDPVGADQVLMDLLPEPEYLSCVAAEMARHFVPKPERSFRRTLPYELVWASREGRRPQIGDVQRRKRFGAALNSEIKRLQEQSQKGEPAAGLKELAKALAAIDGRDSATVVLEVIATPGQWDHQICLEAAERLLMEGVILPASITFCLVDSIVERTEKWLHDSDRYLLCRILALCPFVDDPTTGIAKVRDVLDKRQIQGAPLRDLVTALGESRSDAAIDLLCELASDAHLFEQYEDNFIIAVCTLGTSRGDELLLGFVDPEISSIGLTSRRHRDDVLVTGITDLARRHPKTAARLLELCDRDLPELNRNILSRVMALLGTPEALAANLNLIEDARPSPVPQGVWDQLKSSFVERRPDGEDSNAFSVHARASNELRVRLFRMTIEDERRRKSAFMLLGQIEEWRLEYGRPIGEPRHPDLASGRPWPLNEP